MYQTPKLEFVKDNVLRIHHPDTTDIRTYLTASVSATGTTLTVANNAGFSNTDPQDLLLFEGFGIENAEVKRVDGAITAGTSLTTTAVTFPHGINTEVIKILFDQVEISGASTATGAKTTIDTVNLNVSGDATYFVVTGTTYSYYFARFKNSLSTTPYYSDYSGAVASTDFAVNTVGFIRRNAFRNLNEEFGGKFSADWVYDQLYLIELDVAKELKRWSWLTAFDTDLGNVTVGMNRIALPSDIEDSKTNKSILGVRIGKEKNLDYMDKVDYEDFMQDVGYTTLASAINISDTTVTLTDSRDFDDSGTINIEDTTYSYTANDRTTNVLSGFTAFTAGVTNGTSVWQNVSFGEPMRYTVFDGYLYFDIPPSDDFDGRNIWIDYYKTVTKKTADSDTMSVNDPHLLISGLEMAIKKLKSGGELNANDASWLEYSTRKAKLIANEVSGQRLRFSPSVPDSFYRNRIHSL